MKNDYISGVCPNCGGSLQVEPNIEKVTCQFCGTVHIIRQNVANAVTLESFAGCPLCERNDRSEKVSAIIRNQTTKSDSVINQQQVYKDKKGKTVIKNVAVPVQTQNISELAKRLAPPTRPISQSEKSLKFNVEESDI
jgi:Zn-finger nucleic acid-binding protein